MINEFKDLEMRKSGVIYSSTLEQIKKLYSIDPERAGELAISAIELLLTGEISSDDVMIELMLTTTKAVNQNTKDKHDQKVEAARSKKIEEMRLDEIAELQLQGCTQAQIGKKLGLTQQVVSYRAGIIRTKFPELLQKNSFVKNEIESTKIQENLEFVQESTKKEDCTNFVQKSTNGNSFVF